MTNFPRCSLLVVSLVLSCVLAPAEAARKGPPPQTATEFANGEVPVIFDAGRVLLNVAFETPEGGERKALVWFNMGMAAPVLTSTLYQELAIVRGRPLRLRIGDHAIMAAAADVVNGDGGLGVPDFRHLFAPQPVEAMLPASLLQQSIVTLDYGRHSLAIAEPGAQKPEGVAVPCEVNSKTGVIAIDAKIGDGVYPLALDAGAGYSWVRGDVARGWMAQHPDWRRAFGAVGPANANMVDFAFEKDGVVFRVPRMTVGALSLDNVGALATAPILGVFADGLLGDFFWDNWRKAAPTPVIGWLGGNVLKDYKLTIDYPNRMTYWRKQRSVDLHELDQPGLTLVRRDDRYFIGNFVRNARTAGADEVIEGAEIGDELVAVDGAEIRGAGREVVLSKLHGAPGDRRRLLLERDGARIEIDAVISGYD
jgi:hypothetical protein